MGGRGQKRRKTFFISYNHILFFMFNFLTSDCDTVSTKIVLREEGTNKECNLWHLTHPDLNSGSTISRLHRCWTSYLSDLKFSIGSKGDKSRALPPGVTGHAGKSSSKVVTMKKRKQPA